MKLMMKKSSTKCGSNFEPVQVSHSLFKSENEKSSQSFRLFIGDFQHEPEELDEIFFNLEQANLSDTLEIDIHSNGGYIYELQRFENLIKNIFPKRTVTYLNPYGYSAGALLFLLGDERVCFENSQIMLHNATSGYGGKFSDIKRYADFEMSLIENYIIKILSKFMSKTEIKDLLDGKEFWFDTLEMCKRGMCTQVVINSEYIDPKEYIKLMEPKISKVKKPQKVEKPKTKKPQKVEKVQEPEKPSSPEKIQKPKKVEKVQEPENK